MRFSFHDGKAVVPRIVGDMLVWGNIRIGPDDVVRESRTWLGTKWHHHACVKGVGVDCVHLPFAVCKSLGLLPEAFVMPEYVETPDGKALIATCDRWLRRVGKNEMRPGDMVVLQPDDRPQHVAIISREIRPRVFSIIHASRDHGKVIEHRLMFARNLKFVAAYRFPGI